MRNDVVDIRDFYQSRLGQVARHLIGRRLRAIWPDLGGRTVLGLGYATPYLRQFRDEAERVLAIMPAAQGALHWPPEGPNAVALADETELPLPDMSVDRVLLVHGLEHGDRVADMLREIWRVMTGDWEVYVPQASIRYEFERGSRWRVEAGKFSSPIGLGMTENRASVNDGVIWWHRGYYSFLPAMGGGAAPHALISSIYPMGIQANTSAKHWDVTSPVTIAATAEVPDRTSWYADTTVGYLVSPETTVRLAHSAIRRWNALAVDHQVGISIVWSRRWW